jgi:hypothetical protein
VVFPPRDCALRNASFVLDSWFMSVGPFVVARRSGIASGIFFSAARTSL